MNKGLEEKLDSVMSALASGHRRKIIYRLSLQPVTISMLAHELELSLPAIYKHIKVLKESGLVQQKKIGRCNFLALHRGSLEICHSWLTQFHSYWGSDDETLENYARTLQEKS